jgi:hypothetical protein
MSSHWGLTSWCNGVQEYIVNSYCGCDNIPKKDGAYIIRGIFSREITGKENTSDCACCRLEGSETPPYFCIQNAIGGTICMPLAIVAHVLCLPIMCCYDTREQWDESGCGTSKIYSEDTKEVEKKAEKKAEKEVEKKVSLTRFELAEDLSTHSSNEIDSALCSHKYYDHTSKDYVDSQKRWYSDEKKRQDDQFNRYQTQSFVNQTYNNLTNMNQYQSYYKY